MKRKSDLSSFSDFDSNRLVILSEIKVVTGLTKVGIHTRKLIQPYPPLRYPTDKTLYK